jgi:streptomycin 6-kinase
VLTDDVRRGIESRGGEQGRAWVAALPAIVERLCDRWSLAVGPVLGGGKGSLVLRVTRDGDDAVLKIAPPDSKFASEIATIEAAAGRGYVRLLAHDLDVNAALLEPLGEMLLTRSLAVEEKLDILAATLVEAWKAPKPPATSWQGRGPDRRHHCGLGPARPSVLGRTAGHRNRVRPKPARRPHGGDGALPR